MCLALPGGHEVEAWNAPTFRVKNKMFAMFVDAESGHNPGRDTVWIKSTPENQTLLIAARPERFFKPPYVGPSGWVGVYLDKRPSWAEVAELLADAYALAAPRPKKRTGKAR